jgi:hypothetical protein
MRLAPLPTPPSLALAFLLIAPFSAFAQGSRSSGGPASPDTFNVLRHVTGVLVSADAEEGALVVKPDGGEENVTFKVLPKIRLSAEKKTPLAGRKDLALSDYAPGQPVKVTFRATDRTAVELRLRAPRP